MINSLKNEKLIENNKNAPLITVFSEIPETIDEALLAQSDQAMGLLSEASQHRLLAFSHPKRRYQSTQARLLLKRAMEITAKPSLDNVAQNALIFEERTPDSPLVHASGASPSIWASSLSHTDGAIACGIAPRPWATLVDIECIHTHKPLSHHRKLMEAVFDDAFIEAFDRALESLSEPEAYARFYRYWGAYECRVKANTRATPENPRSPRKRFLLALKNDDPFLVDTDLGLAYPVGFSVKARTLAGLAPRSASPLAISYIGLNTAASLPQGSHDVVLTPERLTLQGRSIDMSLVTLPVSAPIRLTI